MHGGTARPPYGLGTFEMTNNLFLQTRGLPSPAKGEQAHYILERLANLSRPFGTIVEVKGDTAEIKLKGEN